MAGHHRGVVCRPLARIALFAAVALSAFPVAAQAARAYSLQYEAGGACATEAELVAQIAERTQQAVRKSAPPTDVDASVRIEKVETGLRASVEIRAPEGTSRREVSGNDCGELTRALALMIAIAIDPDAETRAQTPPEPSRAPTLPPPTPSMPPKETPREPRELDSPSTVWLGAGATAGAMGGVSPKLSLYFGAFVELGGRSASLLSPSVRLSGLLASSSTETSAGNADFDWLALRLAGCPIQAGSSWFGRACATFDFGRLRGEGSDTENPQSQSSAWYGPGASVELGTTAFGWLTIRFDAGIVAPLARDRFYFRPDVTAHRIPPALAYAGLALGFRT